MGIVAAPNIDENVVELFKYTSLMIWDVLSNNNASGGKI